jgi:RecA-family ATPase
MSEPAREHSILADAREKLKQDEQRHNGNGKAPPSLDCESWWRDPATIPKREFLYSKHYIRKNISATIGAGGRLKTSQAIFEAIEMAVGSNLTTNDPLACGPLRVVLLNAEEDQDELDRRAAAICQRYSVSKSDLGGRLVLMSIRDKPLRIAVMQNATATLNVPALTALRNLIIEKHADIFILDPWISFHSVRESSNEDMDLAIKEGLGKIAIETNSAGEILHHPGKPKPGQIDTTVEDARGASAIIWAVRSARVFNFMTTEEAQQLGISEEDRRRHIRVANGKANMGPLGKAEWVKIEVENLPNNDEVAVPSCWKPPDPFEGVSTADMETGRKLAATGEYRADMRSPNWFGYKLADLLHIPVSYGAENDKKDLARLQTIIKRWVKNKALKVISQKDGKGMDRKFIVGGTFQHEGATDSMFEDDELTIQ